jgi:hypothetical protein
MMQGFVSLSVASRAPRCSRCGEPGGRAVVTRSATEAEGERVYHLAYVWRCLACRGEWLDGRPLLCPFESPRGVGLESIFVMVRMPFTDSPLRAPDNA